MPTKIEKLPSGNYRIRTSYVDETGKQRFKSFTAPTPKKATYLALDFDIENKRKKIPNNISLKDAIENHINSRKHILSPSTIVGYNQLLRNAYSPILDSRIGNITKDSIQKTINEYAKNHSSKSVRNALALLSATLKEVRPDLDLELTLPPNRKRNIIIPTTEEVKLILCESKGTTLYIPILFGAMLGLRRSEIFALTWQDINLKAQTITINKAMVLNELKEYVIKNTKTTSSERTLSLPQFIMRELPNADKPLLELTIDQFSNKYRNLCGKLGVPQSFHALRHYNASVMLQLNIPNKYAMERMGHATDNMLKKVYQHTFKDEQDIVSERLDKFFEEQVK